ncbi:SGNH/GDSL hydrolase family protein [Nocardioides dilutus]
MPVSRLAVRKQRVVALVVATTVVLGFAVTAGLVATGPAASSSTRFASPAPAAPQVVAQAVTQAVTRVMADTAETVHAKTRLARTLMVFGDSISARFNNRGGDAAQGFWSMVAHELGARPEVRAEGGAGFVNPGLVGCTGSTFAQQLARPGVAEVVAGAGAVIIEGGRTDTQTCRPGGGYDLVPNQQVRRAAESFMAEIQRLRGPDRTCTIVVVPWGPAGRMDNRDRITRVVRDAATRHGFTFIDTLGLLTETTTLEDGVHPTRKGNKALTQAILDQSRAEGCFARH